MLGHGSSIRNTCRSPTPAVASPVTYPDLFLTPASVLPVGWLQVSHTADSGRPLDRRTPRSAHWQQSKVTASPAECSVGSSTLLSKRAGSSLPNLPYCWVTDRLLSHSHKQGLLKSSPSWGWARFRNRGPGSKKSLPLKGRLAPAKPRVWPVLGARSLRGSCTLQASSSCWARQTHPSRSTRENA